jgi:hypothetical protein
MKNKKSVAVILVELYSSSVSVKVTYIIYGVTFSFGKPSSVCHNNWLLALVHKSYNIEHSLTFTVQSDQTVIQQFSIELGGTIKIIRNCGKYCKYINLAPL